MLAIVSEGQCERAALASGSWRDGVKLYQPLETEQILLPENASCLAVRAFLRMLDLKCEVVQKKNAEDMSPSGRLPFVQYGQFLICDLEPLASFLENKNRTLTKDLDALAQSDMRAYMSLMSTVLANAEEYITWVDRDTYDQVTSVRYSSVHPWPLGWFVTRQKRRRVMKRLSVLGWLDKTIEEVYEEVDSCCTALSERLDENKFFFGDKPTELDAVVFAHIFTILTTPLPSNQLAATVRCYPKLVEHCMRIEKEYFSEQSSVVDQPNVEDKSKNTTDG